VFQLPLCKKDDWINRNNYLVITCYQLQNTTLFNTLLSSLTPYAAELVSYQEYGAGRNLVNVWERCFTYTYYPMLLCTNKATCFGWGIRNNHRVKVRYKITDKIQVTLSHWSCPYKH
jgi:hypothetical protein